MTLAINVWGGGGGGRSSSLGIYNPLVRMRDDNLVGSSLKSDGVTNANGTLYPTGINDASGPGSINTQINTIQQTFKWWGFFPKDNYAYTTLQTKTKVADKWFSKYKNFKQVKVAGVIQKPTFAPTITGAEIQVRKTIELNSSALVILYQAGTTINAVAATIGANGALTYGTAIEIINNTQNEEHVDICLIGTDKFAVCYKNASNFTFAVVCTVSGTTITLGTGVTMSISLATTNASICSLGTDKFIVVYKNSSDSLMYAKAATVSGTTITVGTVSASMTSRTVGTIFQNGTDKACIFFNDSGSYTLALSLTVSGTTITLWTSVQITSGNASAAIRGTVWGINRTFDCVRLAADKFLFAVYSSSVITTVVITMSGNVITAGTSTILYVQNPTAVAQNTWAAPELSVALCEITAGSDYILYGNYVWTRMTISGTSVTINWVVDNGILWNDYTDWATRLNVVTNATSAYDISNTFATSSYAHSIFKHLATGYSYMFGRGNRWWVIYLFCAISNSMSVSFYNNDVIIGSAQTLELPFLFDSHNILSAITTGKKAYLGIRNNEAATRHLYVFETLLEVE